MTYEQLIGHFGGPSRTARALGVDDRRTVDRWRVRGRVPSKWQAKAEVLTRGKLTADRATRREFSEMAALVKAFV